MSGAHFAFTDRWGGVSAVPYEELNLGGAVGDDPDAVRAMLELGAETLRLVAGTGGGVCALRVPS
ncbi:laccase domain-containing protein, partial [Streptomyces sp. NPDC057927]